MTPYKHQTRISRKAYRKLIRDGFVYLAMAERTGKTLTSILTAEKTKYNNILVITKKNAMKDWNETLKKYPVKKNYTVINYHSIHKLEKKKFDLTIADEVHSSGMGSFPKPSQLYKNVRKITYYNPIIFLSATPYAESKSQLYHQLNLTQYSPFTKYKNFYRWFDDYGIKNYVYFSGREIIEYKTTKDDLLEPLIKKHFITYTREQLGFKYEPEDVKHYIKLDKATKDLYNTLLNDNILPQYDFVADSPMKLRTGLYQIENGTLKIDETTSIELGNTEKIDFIKKNFKEDVAVMGHFVKDQELLKKHFKNVYSSTSHAEGISLAHIDELVIYSMDFSTSRFIQRRARQANMKRDKPIKVHFLLVKDAVSEQVYNAVAIKKENFTNSLFKRSSL
jgi:hypothetical protein